MIRPAKALLLGASLAAPDLAFAHAPIEGIDNFYNGLIHPFIVPAQLLLGIATGLFIGQKGMNENQIAIGVFLVAVIAGLVFAWFSVFDEPGLLILAGAAVIGLLVALNLPAGPYWCSLLTALVGLLLGMDSTQETLSGQDKFMCFLGTALGLFLLLFYPMGLANYLHRKKPWHKIGVRIAGSWLAASALLVLALSLSRAV